MKFANTFGPLGATTLRSSSWVLCAAASLVLAACGSGGGGVEPLVPEAVVQSVAKAQALEGQAGTPLLEFVVKLNKPVERSLVVAFNTSSTAKTGIDSTGSAKGGLCATTGVDFVAVTNTQVTIPAGSIEGRLTVEVCPDAVFEPNESLKLNWTSAGAAGGVAIGTIINDDAGGLNGTGATTLLGGLPVFGRDVNPLTNDVLDGALGFSFDKSNPGCVVDKVSGLTWQRPSAVTLPYADLGVYVASVNANPAVVCGFTDWRVPTANELLSLMNASQTTGNPINADYMGTAADAMVGQFWTSESRSVGGPGAVDAWQLDASNGASVSFVNKASSLGVRLVRGAGSAQVCNNNDLRFTDFGDGTVEDRVTGLMWKKCPEGYSDFACTLGVPLSFSSVNQVVTTAAGYPDWRIPTRNELASLVNRACTDQAIVTAVFPGNGLLNFVTATLYADLPMTHVWGVNFNDGSIGPNALPGSFHLRLVRAGQ